MTGGEKREMINIDGSKQMNGSRDCSYGSTRDNQLIPVIYDG